MKTPRSSRWAASGCRRAARIGPCLLGRLKTGGSLSRDEKNGGEMRISLFILEYRSYLGLDIFNANFATIHFSFAMT